MKYHELKEADKPRTKTKTKDRPMPTMDPDADMPKMAPSHGAMAKAEPKAKTKVSTKTVSKDKTATMQPNMPTGAGDVMRSFMNKTADVTDVIPGTDAAAATDDEVNTPPAEFGTPEPKPPGQDVAVISKEVALDQYNVNWHEVKNLPGYAVQQIRGAFRPLFKNVLGAELEEVSVATSIDPENSKKNMKRLIGYIGKHGEKLDDFNLEAFDIDPEQYKITKAYVYNLGGASFFVMEEKMMGEKNYYVYVGPEKEDFDKVTSPQKPERDIEDGGIHRLT